MKIIKYYQFMSWDGGDRHNATEPAFLNKEDANRFLGDNKYDRFEERSVIVYESVEEFESVNNENVKQQALAKLSDIEKKALGLI